MNTFGSENNLEEKFARFLELYEQAINIVIRYINQIEKDKNLESMIPALESGLKVLEGHKKALAKRGVDNLGMHLQRSERGGRPGLGLNRGFGEFLYNFKNRGFKDEWADEIMDAVDKIEDYYNEM